MLWNKVICIWQSQWTSELQTTVFRPVGPQLWLSSCILKAFNKKSSTYMKYIKNKHSYSMEETKDKKQSN